MRFQKGSKTDTLTNEELYKELCVQIFEGSVINTGDAQIMLRAFKSVGATELEAHIKLAEVVIEGNL